MKYVFAGDREISVDILKFLIARGYRPSALFISDANRSSHADELATLSGLGKQFIFEGGDFKNSLQLLKEIEIDYIFGIHFPYIIPSEFLQLPEVGFLNLHPAYLPFNKGWHTPSWAIIEGTKYGATLHFMSENLDEGDIIHQKELVVAPEDTANSVYAKALELEKEVFYEAFPNLLSLQPKSMKQESKGTSHLKKDLEKIQEIDLDKTYTGKQIINLLRGLTTNNINEAAYFTHENRKYYMQISIKKQVENK